MSDPVILSVYPVPFAACVNVIDVIDVFIGADDTPDPDSVRVFVDGVEVLFLNQSFQSGWSGTFTVVSPVQIGVRLEHESPFLYEAGKTVRIIAADMAVGTVDYTWTFTTQKEHEADFANSDFSSESSLGVPSSWTITGSSRWHTTEFGDGSADTFGWSAFVPVVDDGDMTAAGEESFESAWDNDLWAALLEEVSTVALPAETWTEIPGDASPYVYALFGNDNFEDFEDSWSNDTWEFYFDQVPSAPAVFGIAEFEAFETDWS